MEKIFVGPKVRRLREDRDWRLEDCAARLGLSPSYLSQIETNQRPVTARVLIALTRAFEVDASVFDAGDDDRLVADLREVTLDAAIEAPAPSLIEVKTTVQNAPGFARQFLALHRAYRRLDERLKALDEALALDETASASARLPYEEVRDYFHYRNNYVADLDTASETLAETLGLAAGVAREPLLERALHERWEVRVVRTLPPRGDVLRRYDPAAHVLEVDAAQPGPTRAFQIAHQLVLLEFGEKIEALLDEAQFNSEAARQVCRVALGNYAAAALLLPYRRFLEAAQRTLHDVEVLQTVFFASFEQICHRLSTLQRPGVRGVPFFFVRVDQAGNITKRHSATRFQFARFGGACPLWNVHEAFAEPGKILVQIAEMPDGARYLCVARSIIKRSGSYLGADRRFALGFGCEIEHAKKLVYAQGLDLGAPAARIGVSCRICPREDCPQRAFPPVDKTLHVDALVRKIIPYRIDGPA
jgi:hypothetical protein